MSLKKILIFSSILIITVGLYFTFFYTKTNNNLEKTIKSPIKKGIEIEYLDGIIVEMNDKIKTFSLKLDENNRIQKTQNILLFILIALCFINTLFCFIFIFMKTHLKKVLKKFSNNNETA